LSLDLSDDAELDPSDDGASVRITGEAVGLVGGQPQQTGSLLIGSPGGGQSMWVSLCAVQFG
jgi:hypothetical protein